MGDKVITDVKFAYSPLVQKMPCTTSFFSNCSNGPICLFTR